MRPKDTILLDAMNDRTPAKSPSAVKGTGGGLADFVPAMIDGEQPAALSEGEFVFPADVVALLGDGSTDAGARILDKLVKKIRQVKQTKNGEQADPLKDLLKPKKKQK